VITVEIVPPSAVLAQIQTAMQSAPRLMTTAYKRNMSRLASRWKQALSAEPPPAQQYYPIHWKTAKQRRAFFATDGFGRGIPSARTHELAKAWKVEVLSADAGGSIIVSNKNPAASYVYGDEINGLPRQPMFDASLGGIPWLDADEVNFRYADEATLVLQETWLTVSDPHAGVKP